MEVGAFCLASSVILSCPHLNWPKCDIRHQCYSVYRVCFMSQFCEQKQLLVQDIRILKGLLLQKRVKLKYENDKMDNIRHFNTKKMFIKTNIQTGTKAPLSPKWPCSYCHKSKTPTLLSSSKYSDISLCPKQWLANCSWSFNYWIFQSSLLII